MGDRWLVCTGVSRFVLGRGFCIVRELVCRWSECELVSVYFCFVWGGLGCAVSA